MRPLYITRVDGEGGGSLRRVTVEYFTDPAKGFDDNDLKAIQRLDVGATWNDATGRGVPKSVKRVA